LKLIDLKNGWGYTLHKAAGSSVLDGWDDIEEDLGDSTWPSSLTSSPAEAEGTGEMEVRYKSACNESHLCLICFCLHLND
jgi:hypothetical protein